MPLMPPVTCLSAFYALPRRRFLQPMVSRSRERSSTAMRELLSLPEVAGVAEMMDMRGVLAATPRMQAILQAGLRSGKLIEGHARGLAGPQLQAYLAAGITS